ncbi:energy-coupling factor ABC transporter substrate-binding protein [Saccharicrinis aurantiacus]|uniref:energy-coupling factor ABC transporter substrate-binding protein n=1 Tax=Saccharicrinis aurantiacus TaxID=1849719 RepID=UPI000837B3C0|nr:cobalt transport protein CbiN [Saccharicrinis aurantiacus]
MTKTKRITLWVGIAVVAAVLFQIGMADTLSLFDGTDDQSVEVIQQIDASFEPIFEPFWEPGSDKAETLLFALQTLIGVGIIGAYIIYSEKRKKAKACK